MASVKIKITNATFGPKQQHWPAGHVATVTEAQARAYIGANKAVPAGMVKKAAAAVRKAVKGKSKK